MEINTTELIASLHIMWKGILLLFMCCGFIALVTMCLNAILKPKKDAPEK